MFDIVPSPNDGNCFVLLWKQDLYLFHVVLNKSKGYNDKSFGFTITRDGLWRCSTYPLVLSWLPCLNNEGSHEASLYHFAAVGGFSGTVKLFSLREWDLTFDRFRLQNKELVPVYSGKCICLVWNPWKPNLLAQVLDIDRPTGEPTILIWDVTRSSGNKENVTLDSEDEFATMMFHSSDSCGSHLAENQLPTKIFPACFADSSRSKRDGSLTDIFFCDKPVCDLGAQEVTSSFAWLSRSSFIVGTSTMLLKVFDLSDPSKACQVTSTGAVNGLTVDPLCCTRMASFSDRQISIWNTTYLVQPIYTFTEQSDIIQIKWSPLKESWLGVLLADSCAVKMYDTYPMLFQTFEESEQAPMERWAFPSQRTAVPLVAFSWHATLPDYLLTVDIEGCLDVAHIFERVVLGWSSAQTLTWTHSGMWTSVSASGLVATDDKGVVSSGNASIKVLPECHLIKHQGEQLLTSENRLLEDQPCHPSPYVQSYSDLVSCLNTDIAAVMRRRATMGYGSSNDISAYINIVQDDPQLHTMWSWIKYVRDYMDNPIRRRVKPTDLVHGGLRVGSELRYAGAISILSSESTAAADEVLSNAKWKGLEASLSFPRYCSPDRSRVLRLCMWPLNDSEEVQRQVLESLCAVGQYERAAMMALINLNFEWALKFLKHAAAAARIPNTTDSNASRKHDAGLVALALAGYTDGSNDVWHEVCANMIDRLDNAYLRVMFTFLNCQGDDFEPILNNEKLDLIDRVAFACLYLSNEKLLRFLQSTCNRLVRLGRLEGLLLTGFSSKAFLSLIQSYLELTSDVQTAAILSLYACQLTDTSSSSSDPTPNQKTHSQLSGVAKTVQGSTTDTRGITERQLSKPVNDSIPTLIKLGGTCLANWVQCYRDLLDQWRMWFCRADFDILYESRLISNYLNMNVSRLGNRSTSKQSRNGKTSLDDSSSKLPSTASNPGLNSFDIAVSRLRTIGLSAPSSQLFVACSFCGWRLTPYTKQDPYASDTNNTESYEALSSSATEFHDNESGSTSGTFRMHAGGGKKSICRHCRKPLARCSICLMHLGTAAPRVDQEVSTSRENMIKQSATSRFRGVSDTVVRSIKLSIQECGDNLTSDIKNSTEKSLMSQSSAISVPESMANWFIWCQGCRHGGHANHLVKWFYGGMDSADEVDRNIRCPVNGCQCKCTSLDSGLPFSVQFSSDKQDFISQLIDHDSSSDSDTPTAISDSNVLDDVLRRSVCH